MCEDTIIQAASSMEYIEILKGLLTPLIGGIALYIAWQQHKTNKARENRESRKAKLDVYKKVQRFLNNACYKESLNQSNIDELQDAISEADFLFPDEVITWLRSLLIATHAAVGFEQAAIEDEAEFKKTSSAPKKYILISNIKAAKLHVKDAIEELNKQKYSAKKLFSKYIK